MTPPFGCAVELRENQACDVGHLRKELGLRDRILPRVGVEYEKTFVGRVGNFARDHAGDLLELFHQGSLRLQAVPPCR